MDGSPPGSCVHEIFPARILEWVATSFCRGSSQPRDRTRVSCPARRFFTNRRSIVHGILQARILEWVAFPFSRGSSQPKDWIQVSRVAGGFFTSWATREAQEYWSVWPIPSPVDLPNPGIEPGSPTLPVASLPTELWGKLSNVVWEQVQNKSFESSDWVFIFHYTFIRWEVKLTPLSLITDLVSFVSLAQIQGKQDKHIFAEAG